MTQFYAFFCFILTHQLCSRHCLYRANIATYASAAVPFLTAILHRQIYIFHILFGLLFPFLLWTFISLFYLDIFFSILFQLVFNSFLFFFICFSILFYSIAVTFWSYFSGSFGDKNTEQLYLKIIKGIFIVFSNEMTFYSTA